MTDPYEYEMEAAREVYEEELIKNALKNISQEGVSYYLYSYGDAIETRIRDCLETANELYKEKYFGSSIVSSCTAVEVTIRYFILSPLVQGVFLYEEWADTLANRIVSGRSVEDRKILPQMLKVWGVDINDIKLSSGCSLWQALHERIWTTRNRYVHRGEPVSQELSKQAIEVSTILLEIAEQVIRKAAGYTNKKGRWGSEGNRKDPFV